MCGQINRKCDSDGEGRRRPPCSAANILSAFEAVKMFFSTVLGREMGWQAGYAPKHVFDSEQVYF